MNSGPILHLELRASRALTMVLVLVHGAAAACVLAVAPGYPALLLAALLLLLGAAAAWDRALLRGRTAPRSIDLAAEGAATLVLANGRRLSGRIASRRHVSPLWVTLRLRGASPRTLLIVADMLAHDKFRQLRLWALWGRVGRTGGTPDRAGAGTA